MSAPARDDASDLRANLDAIRARIASACASAGRDPAGVRLLPVSKTVGEARLRRAYAIGLHELGENKVQEALAKSEAMADLPDLRWVLIGHLQTNKARDVAAFAAEFHALDSARLAEALDRRLQAAGRSLDVYIQVNTSAEESKSGLPPEEVLGFLAELPRFDTLRVRGLMTLAIRSDDAERVRACFRLLRTLRDRAREEDLIGPGELSMGMSGDYEMAVEEGATTVRVGQAIFGARLIG